MQKGIRIYGGKVKDEYTVVVDSDVYRIQGDKVTHLGVYGELYENVKLQVNGTWGLPLALSDLRWIVIRKAERAHIGREAALKTLDWVQDLEGMDPGGMTENMQKVWDAIEARIAELKKQGKKSGIVETKKSND